MEPLSGQRTGLLFSNTTVPGLTSYQRLLGVDGGADTDPGLMLIKVNDLITVKWSKQNTVLHSTFSMTDR